MLKRKLLMTILPVLSAAVIVGTGFSAWHFGNTTDSETLNANVVVTEKVNHHIDLAVNTEMTRLLLDQGSTDGVRTEGITFTNDNHEDNKDVLTINLASSSAKTDYTLTVRIDPDEALNTYLEFVGDATIDGWAWSKASQTLTQNVTLTDGKATVTLDLGDKTGKHNVLFNYTDVKPVNSVDYDKMVAALANAKVVFTVTVSE